MSKERFFLRFPVEFKRLCLIYPPSINDVVTTEGYQIYARLLTYSQEEVEDEYEKNKMDLANLLSPFQYMLLNASQDKKYEKCVREAFRFFIHEDVILLYEQKLIVIGEIKDLKSVEEMRLLHEEDFFEFQNLIRLSIGVKEVEPPNPNEDPRVKRIKAKARYRDKIKAKSNKGLNLYSTLASICCMNMGLNPLNIGELSYAAVPALISIYQNKEKYETDVSSLLAGADAKKVQPVYWIGNIDN